MELPEKMDITLTFKNGFSFTVTLTDPKRMWEVVKSAGVWSFIGTIVERVHTAREAQAVPPANER